MSKCCECVSCFEALLERARQATSSYVVAFFGFITTMESRHTYLFCSSEEKSINCLQWQHVPSEQKGSWKGSNVRHTQEVVCPLHSHGLITKLVVVTVSEV